MPLNNTSPITTWQLRPDPQGVGLQQCWFDSTSPEATKHWQSVSLPTTSQQVLGEHFHEITWLRTEVALPADWPQAVTRLRFEAVATEATVWVNGEPAGTHTGDYLPFDIDISRWARPGARLHVVVRVDEVPDHITKGFHDLTSVHHGGIWQPVRLIGSDVTRTIPDGVAVNGRLRAQQAVVHLNLVAVSPGALVNIAISDPTGATVRRATLALSRTSLSYKVHLGVSKPKPWHPGDPQRYSARIALLEESGVSEMHELRFGFRDVRTEDRHILLNGEPIFLSGVLHWGHEPNHFAPAPPPAQVRAEFARLQAMGFNCVCLCMFYPPEHYFEIADEMGMLLWQEHPVWQSRMDDRDVPEYQRHYRGFMRRDRRHTSTIIVSATCEHPKFHAGLADWWWRTARTELSDRLLQLQTASFAWADHSRTDLHDEHTYDNNDRWPCFLEDLQEKLTEFHAKPFVMGESVLFHSWPDLRAIAAKTAGKPAFYAPDALESMQRLEATWCERYGDAAVERFKRQGDRHHLLGRKFQFELFRRYAGHAGLVMNHLIDVHQCTCGFMDAMGRWRFEPKDTQPWLCPAPLLLKTPAEKRFFLAGETVDCELLLSNVTGLARSENAALELPPDGIENARTVANVQLACDPGEIVSAGFELALPNAETPTRCALSAAMPGTVANHWDLWAVPAVDFAKRGVYRLSGLDYDDHDRRLDKEEAGYSCGFGIPAKAWQRLMPEPSRIAPEATALPHDAAVPKGARFVIAHRLTAPLLRFLEDGGSVLLLASKARGAIQTRYLWLFGQVPFIVEEGPLRPGDSDWLLDGLCFDLNFANGRAIAIEELGLRDSVEPFVRLVYTHDQKKVVLYDQLFATRVGRGTLIVSALDHACDIGRLLLERFIEWASTSPAEALPALPGAICESLVCDAEDAIKAERGASPRR
jgi:Glycosyl hydrolases family 2, sugar binding domain/Glycosyl hydrolases family 2